MTPNLDPNRELMLGLASMSKFGPALRNWRETAGLSREAVAAAARVSLSTLKNWEGDTSSPRLTQLESMLPLAPGLRDAIFKAMQKKGAS